MVNQPYNQTISVAGGTGSDTFAVTSGNLPAGLSLNTSSGAITGTPTSTSGSPFSFTISATDSTGAVASQNYVEFIYAVPTITTLLPSWTVGQPYNQTIILSGGTSPENFSVSSGGLPPGLSLNSVTGAVIGTPTNVAGSPFSFTVTARDMLGNTASQAYSVAINPQPTISSQFSYGLAGEPYSQVVTVSGGTGQDTFAILYGILPTGLTLNTSTGVVSGTPPNTSNSPFEVTITATDTAGAVTAITSTIPIYGAPPVVNPLPNWTVGQVYTATPTLTGGYNPTSFTVSSGSLPPGLTLNTGTGLVSGTPTSVGGPFAFTITGTDSSGDSVSGSYSVIINSQPTITTTLPNWTVNSVYNQTIHVTGGTNPDTFAVSSGALPAGLILNSSSGVISGTPTTAGGPFSFTISASDSAGAVASHGYALTINTQPTITTTSLPAGIDNTPYAQSIAVVGGTAPDTFAVTAGSLPPGLTLNSSTGAITGTPTTTSGSPFSFIVTATDLTDAIASKNYTVAINTGSTITTTSLPNWTVNSPYSQTIAVSGASTP